MSILRLAAMTISVGALVATAGVACGQDYPNRPIRIVTGAAGGGTDFPARQMAQGLSGPLGQPVVVDNRTQGLVAAETASKASPDGYTLTVAASGLWVLPLLQKTPYDAVRDFSPVSLLIKEVNAFVVHPLVPAATIKELIALAKAKPGALNYSSGGAAGSTNLAVELFKSMAGVNIVHVAYKGGGAATTALFGGEVQMTLMGVGAVGPHVKSGKLKALAVTSAEPSAMAPGLPTVAASGVPGYEAIGLMGLLVPAKTPDAIINRLNREAVRVVNQADAKEKFLSVGMEVIGSSPEQFAASIKSEVAKWGKVIKEAGLKVD